MPIGAEIESSSTFAPDSGPSRRTRTHCTTGRLLPARQAFSRTLTGRGFREEARLELAHFRNDAGLIGAADLARHAMIEPPDSAHFGFWPRRRKAKPRRARARRESRWVVPRT